MDLQKEKPRWVALLLFWFPVALAFTLLLFGHQDTFNNAQAASLSDSTLLVEASAPATMGAVSLTIIYDNSLVIFESVTASGGGSGGIVMPNSKPEQGWVKVGLIKASGFGSGEVMRLKFRVIGSGVPDQRAFTIKEFDITDLAGRTLADADIRFSVQNNP